MSNFDPKMNFLLLPISFLYQGILTLRHKLYDWHVLKSEQFDLPVICVGNLSLGGTGKTPHSEYLIRILKDDYRVALLSRGYGRKTNGFRLADTHCGADDIGDEPVLYVNKYPDVTLAVDEDRAEGIRKLLAMPDPPQVILLDDAFQHRRINAGLNILLTEYGHLYCNDALLPAGTLRDVRSAARRADLIVVSKSPCDLREERKAEIIEQLKPLPHQKVYFSSLEPKPLRAVNDCARAMDAENADTVLLFCGIANPKPFIQEMQVRYRHRDVMTFADHHPYTKNDVETLLKRYHNLEGEKKIIVTTEKDHARLINNPYLCQFETVPLFVAPIETSFFDKEKFKIEILNYVRKNYQHG